MLNRYYVIPLAAMKTINASDENWAALSKLKIDLKEETIDAVLTRLINRFNLNEELAKHLEVTGVRKK